MLEITAAFDIETTSYTRYDGKKCATMYVWQLGINGVVIMGRTWIEFQEVLHAISEFFGLNDKRKMFIYVHNLPYEFQFMRRWFEWRDVFAIKPRAPISAEIVGLGIVFRCSMALTGCKLQTLAGKLRYFPDVEKKVGELDYKKRRHFQSTLQPSEIEYCIFDVVVVMCYIAQCMEDETTICKIPRTKTGYVRRRCRDEALYHKSEPDEKKRKRLFFDYRKLMSMLTLTPDEYLLLRRAFCGGFTHANCYSIGTTIHNMRSMDFSSAYPAAICIDYFPMSRGRVETVNDEAEYRRLCGLYCVVADVTFYNLQPRLDYEFYISKSKCRNFEYEETTNARGKKRHREKCSVDNGRIVSAPRLTTSITELDFEIIEKCYTWDKIEIGECYSYMRGRLPSDFVRIVADLYEGKTTLKGVAGMEKEYMLMKEDLNSLYGMLVTDILRDILEYNGEWLDAQTPDLEDVIEKYNKSGSRFGFYAWGIYVTSHVRRRLWGAILECGLDYKYSDTDSVKLQNYSAHEDYFNAYNNSVLQALKASAQYHKIPLEKFIPKTKKGVLKPLGFWDFDGDYSEFKTLGAKRYMYKADTEKEVNGKKLIIPNDLHCTIAGVNPETAAEYFGFKYNANLNYFTEGLEFPKTYINADGEKVSGTGKLTHTYFDDELHDVLTDSEGRKCEIYERSYVHLDDSEYSLSIADDFINYLYSIGGYEFEAV